MDLTNIINNIDELKAVSAIQTAFDKEAAGERKLMMLRGFSERKSEPVIVTKFGQPQYLRLCFDKGNAMQNEEVVLTITGVLVSHELHPKLKDVDYDVKAAFRLKRRVFICGYGNYDFDRTVQDIAYIYELFRQAESGHIRSPPPRAFNGYFLIEAGNKFFTQKSAVPYETYRPYPRDEDPFGCANRAALQCSHSSPVVRTQENDVLFYKKDIETENGIKKSKMIRCSSNEFHAGDIVQIQVSFIAFRAAKEHGKKTLALHMVLRSIALIDNSVRLEADARMFTQPTTVYAPLLPAKRKYGYEHGEGIRKKMAKLTIADISEGEIEEI